MKKGDDTCHFRYKSAIFPSSPPDSVNDDVVSRGRTVDAVHSYDSLEIFGTCRNVLREVGSRSAKPPEFTRCSYPCKSTQFSSCAISLRTNVSL